MLHYLSESCLERVRTDEEISAKGSRGKCICVSTIPHRCRSCYRTYLNKGRGIVPYSTQIKVAVWAGHVQI
eukprot:9024867-Prorocentrum_lima.AAC.1